ncbi:MAG: enoyl-CoA hydratase/isomerase family protein [Proteobacteria bacterium]|nr:enoyl-CoA hydratase/isomerase family protein [Pseudomonadota bacterium]
MEVSYSSNNLVGHLHFPVHNGAMDLKHCKNLLQVYQEQVLADEQAKVVILWGGEDFFSNGIDLNSIHLRYNPAILAYKNLKAINKIVQAILTTTDKLVVAAIQGSAAAGGVMMALAADLRYARSGVVLNPSYTNMGISGSEYWSVLLPALIGFGRTQQLIYEGTPISALEAKRIGLIHDLFAGSGEYFREQVIQRAEFLATHNINARLAAKSVLTHKLLSESTEQVKLELQKMKDCCNHQEFEDSRRTFVEKHNSSGSVFPSIHHNIHETHTEKNGNSRKP